MGWLLRLSFTVGTKTPLLSHTVLVLEDLVLIFALGAMCIPDPSRVRLIGPVFARIGIFLTKQHIRSRVERLLLLYKSRAAALTDRKQKARLGKLSEELRALLDGLPPKPALTTLIAFPVAIGALWFFVGLIPKPQLPLWLAVIVSFVLVLLVVLGYRVKHLMLELELTELSTTDNSAERKASLPASTYALEAELFRCLGCSVPQTVRVDAILLIIAGVLALVGLVGAMVQIPEYRLYLGSLLLAATYILIIQPWKDLQRRRTRYMRPYLPVANSPLVERPKVAGVSSAKSNDKLNPRRSAFCYQVSSCSPHAFSLLPHATVCAAHPQ